VRSELVWSNGAQPRVRRLGILSSVALLLFTAACSPKGRSNEADDEHSESATPERQEQRQPMAPQRNFATYDWKLVDQAIGKTGAPQQDGIYKVSFPRSDLHVTVDGVQLKPSLALGGWVAFEQTGNDQAIVMGDLVLTEDEVSPVMAKLQEGGVQQTALHNHVLHESSRVMYMHIGAQGDPAKIAAAVRAALALSRTPMQTSAGAGGAGGNGPGSATASGPIGVDTAAIARALGHGGKVNGGVYQVSVARAGRITMNGVDVPPAMGLATSMNFQPTGGGRAATTGDFVLIGSEVNPVIQALRQHDIEVTALHSHMLMENPRLFFMHFWANADAVTLASGLRAALDKVDVKKP
jgi:hypothetical protein